MRSLLIVAALLCAVSVALTRVAAFEAEPVSACQSIGYVCLDDGLTPYCGFVCN
jgi:hypothetical protein